MFQSLALLSLVFGSFLLGASPRSNPRPAAQEVSTDHRSGMTGPEPLPSISAPATPTTLTEDELPEGVALETVLAQFETRYRSYGRYRGRAHNVERAAELLDGSILAPGAELSFNETVGARTRRNGFRRATVIENGELVDGMGGGVCQVASTLHAAALDAGLEVPNSRPHSRPSSYIALGLDATVSYPQLDLVVRNPFDYPVLVQARAEGGEMHVELVGQEVEVNVQVERQVLSRSRFSERVVLDPALPLGAREVSQNGIRGASVRLTRTFEDVDSGEERTESRTVRYPSTDQVVRVGTGLL